MQRIYGSVYSPIYAFAVLAVVAVLSWIIGYVVPFCRRELAIEDKSRLTPLDGLRGILCFAVMCHHAALTFGYIDSGKWELTPSNFYNVLGSSAVTFFFCITAFLFWSRVVAKDGALPPWPFLRGRVCRLVPLYLFSSVLALVIARHEIHWLSFGALRGVLKLGYLGLRPWGVVGGFDTSIVDSGVTWSLQYEWGFYLALPALAMLAGGNNSRRLWFLLAAVWVTGPDRALAFFPGILAVYMARIPSIVGMCRTIWVSTGIILVASLYPLLFTDSYGLGSLVAITLIFVPIACGNTVFGLLTLRGLRLMGIVSYSVYLLHGTVLYLAQPLLAHAKQSVGHVVDTYWACVFGLACITLVVSVLTYRWVEWPFMMIDKRWRRAAS